MEAVTEQTERVAVRIVVLWTIDTSLASGESLFAIYLSIDLIAFAMISYVYRVTKTGDSIGRIPLLAGCILLLLLLAAGFAV
jgi:hypothetical protein